MWQERGELCSKLLIIVYLMQGWNEEETKLIVTKFNNYIKKGDKTPPLKECRGLKIGNKTDKQIQDKVRTIIRQQKKI